MKMKTRLMVVVLAALCLSGTPAMADLFHWSVHNLDLSYDGVYYNATASVYTEGGQIMFTRDVPTTGTVSAFPGLASANFGIEDMLISDITASTAKGAGTFTLTDETGDTITGDVTGVWTKTGSGPQFAGSLGNVYWNNEGSDNTFDGYKLVGLSYVPASVSMDFWSSQPWGGSLVQVTSNTTPWFGSDIAWRQSITAAGSVDAHVVPVPAAALLGFLGLGAAGLKLRRFA